MDNAVFVKLGRYKLVLNRKSAGRRAVIAAGLVENVSHMRIDCAYADVQ